jgi:hypothetical protein
MNTTYDFNKYLYIFIVLSCTILAKFACTNKIWTWGSSQYDPVNFVVVISGMTLFAFLSIISVCAHSFCKKGAGKDDTTLFTKSS